LRELAISDCRLTIDGRPRLPPIMFLGFNVGNLA
jgi:hypothetical protein